MTTELDRRQACGLLLGSSMLPTSALAASPAASGAAAKLPVAPAWSRQASLYEVNLRQYNP